MKGFLDKTWAKAAAFVLTLVFGVLTVLGGVGVGILISYDVFLDGGDLLRRTIRGKLRQIHRHRRQLPARHAGQCGRAGQ